MAKVTIKEGRGKDIIGSLKSVEILSTFRGKCEVMEMDSISYMSLGVSWKGGDIM